MDRRTLLLGALAAGMLPRLSFAQQKLSTPLRFYNYNLASAGIGADTTRRMLAAFAEAHPAYPVEGVGVPVPELMGRIQADMVAGIGPDIAQLGFAGLAYARDYLGAVALEDVVPADELKAHLDGMVANGVRLGQLEGKTYGLAYVFSTPILFYNATLFREAGLDPDAPPSTWDEVAAAAAAIHERTGKTGLLTGIFGSSAGDWLFQGIIRSAGGHILSDDRKTLLFDSPEAVAGLTTLRNIARTGAMEPTFDTPAIEAMASGNVGIYLQTSAVQNTLLRGAGDRWELRSAVMPTFGDLPARPSNSGSALVMMTHDPERQRAVWELMRFLTSDWAYTLITSEIGYLPLRPNAINSEEYLAPWIRDHPLILPNLEQLERLEPTVPHAGPNYSQIVQTMMGAGEAAVFGASDDVAGVMTAARQRAQSLMP
jgi:multiple sugar transport system substrate-binding protein